MPHQERIKFLANPVQAKLTGQIFNLLHCLSFWQALIPEGFNCFWKVPLFCQFRLSVDIVLTASS